MNERRMELEKALQGARLIQARAFEKRRWWAAESDRADRVARALFDALRDEDKTAEAPTPPVASSPVGGEQ